MIVAWINGRYALVGRVIEDTGEGYVVEVTSYDLRGARKYLGQKFYVPKEMAQIIGRDHH